ncbi:MAG TPA: DNA gyrase inhibitor YacG, partial [Rhizomicrobium sp.]|nr:DNA gyrase inhibitor YacG [Rhizomicrobium sp.]
GASLPAKDSMSERSPERKCAVCGKPQAEKFKPFCSKRCADVDLSRWLKGVYSVPAEEAPDDLPDEEE